MTTKVLSEIDAQAELVPRVRLVGIGEKLIAVNECRHAIVLEIGEVECEVARIPLAAGEARDVAGEIPEGIFEAGGG